jgi:hypothetical protein
MPNPGFAYHVLESKMEPLRECYTPSVYSVEQDTAIVSLFLNIDEFEDNIKLEYIQQLRKENQCLVRDIVLHDAQWVVILDLLEQLYEALVLLQGGLDRYFAGTKEAENDWLSFWGL